MAAPQQTPTGSSNNTGTQLLTHTLPNGLQILGQRIEISQSDEIKMMQRWLDARGQEAPGVHDHHMPGAALMPGKIFGAAVDIRSVAAHDPSNRFSCCGKNRGRILLRS